MRKVVAELFMTLDGVVEAPDQWHGPYHDDEMGRQTETLIAAADIMLLGRRTYEEHAGYWPEESGGLADQMNTIPKVVVSTTLDSVEWRNSTLVSGDVVEEVARLRRQPGKAILITGSVTLVQSLLREGLVDELRLLIDPVVAGSGRRLFDAGDAMRLELVGSHTFATGSTALTYALPGQAQADG